MPASDSRSSKRMPFKAGKVSDIHINRSIGEISIPG